MGFEEITEQMLDYAFKHENYRRFMDLCYFHLSNWYWSEKTEMVAESIEIYKDLSRRKRYIFVDIESYCLSCIIDEKMPEEKKVVDILTKYHNPEPLPF